MARNNDTHSEALDETGADQSAERGPEAPAESRKGKGDVERPAGGGDEAARRTKIKPTRVSGTWVAVIVAVVVLVFLLIFILQNSASVTVHYLGMSGTLPLGVALLFASVGGAVLVALVAVARMFQLRRLARRGSPRRKR